MRLSLLVNVRINCGALWWRTSGGRRALAIDGRPSHVCSGAELLLLLAAASTTAALLLLPAVTLHRLHRAVTKLDDALPHGLQHRCESRSTTPAPHLSHRPSHSASRRRLPLRGAPCTQLLPARQSQRQPVGVHAAGQTTNCGPTFRARARRGAPPRRAAAPEEKNGPDGAQGEPDSPRRSTPKCSTGKTFFVGNLAKRVKPVSDHVDHLCLPMFTKRFLRVYPPNVRPRRP